MKVKKDGKNTTDQQRKTYNELILKIYILFDLDRCKAN